MPQKATPEPTPFNKGVRFFLFCPGCYAAFKERYPSDERYWENGSIHCFSTEVHGFNRDLEKPTLSPSLLVHSTWGEDQAPFICHSFVRDGMIQFLGDCTHPLANQTVSLMDVPERFLNASKESE